MSLQRYLPNTRETAEETKRRAWRDMGILVVDVERANVNWDVRVMLCQLGERLYGERKNKG